MALNLGSRKLKVMQEKAKACLSSEQSSPHPVPRFLSGRTEGAAFMLLLEMMTTWEMESEKVG